MDDARVEHLRQRQDAGVLAVGGVRGRAEQRRKTGGQAVAQQGAVQAGLGDVVAAQVELMADMSPMCSIIVARERGMMVRAAVASIPCRRSRSEQPEHRVVHVTGRPIHAAARRW